MLKTCNLVVVAIGLFYIRFDLTNDRRMKETYKANSLMSL